MKRAFVLVMLLFGLSVWLPFDITCALTGFEKTFLLVCVVYNAIAIMSFIFVRIFYRTKYIIENDCLTKKLKGNIVFSINSNDIEAIFIKKAKWYDYFYFAFDSFLNGGSLHLMQSHGSAISIIFYRCNAIKKEYSFFDLKRKSIKPDSYCNAFEHSEIMSYAKCVKLARKLNIKPVFV